MRAEVDRGEVARPPEKAVIGAVFRDPGAFAELCDLLVAEDFYHDSHATVWRAFSALACAGQTPDLVGVAGWLDTHGLLPNLDGPRGLGELYESSLPLTGTRYGALRHAERVRELSQRRQLERIAGEIIREASEPSMSGAEAIDWASGQLLALAQQAHGTSAVTLPEAIGLAFDRIDERLANPGAARGVPTGIDAMESLLPGLQAGELIILAARPSVGKTAISLAIASHAARRTRRPVLFCSLEQAAAELAERYLASAADIPLQAIRSGWLDPQAQDALRRAREGAGGLGSLWIDDRAQQSVLRVASQARRIQGRAGLALVVIDYLQLLQPEDRRSPRHEQVGQISRGLKVLARDLGVPVLVLAQLNREVEGRGGRPRLSDLRESGSIEADADTVLLLHRPSTDAAPPAPGAPRLLELIVAKQRNGPTGELSLVFHGDKMRFESPEANPFSGGAE